jgi:hypothetical protein
MNRNSDLFIRRAHKNQRGQVVVLTVMSMAAIFAMVALVFDVGVINYSMNQLQASTQAATFAGAYAMVQNGATAATTTAAATTYSGLAGNKNAHANLPGVAFVAGYPKLYCSTKVQSAYGVQCYGGGGTYNALIVEQTVTVPLIFASLFGKSSLTLTSTATASMKGLATPYNVVILMDTTSSMNDIQSYPDCKTAAITCALQGVQIFLQDLSPCPPTLTTCGAATPNASGGGANVANSVDRVSLLAFPPVLATTANKDYTCGSGAPTPEPYATPFPGTSTYQIVNFSSDYRLSDSAATLNSASDIVKAVGYGATAGCMQAEGGEGTYYAQAVAQAQAYLVAEQALFPGSKNVLIILSDGSANATCSGVGNPCPSGPMTGASTTAATGAYPPESTKQQCHQAIAAAQAAWTAGTIVYAVNFGAEATGCTYDSPTIAPCQTMLEMAYNGTWAAGDTTNYYFSDDGAGACTTTRTTSTLNQIFADIAGDLTVPKLIPNGTP